MPYSFRFGLGTMDGGYSTGKPLPGEAWIRWSALSGPRRRIAGGPLSPLC